MKNFDKMDSVKIGIPKNEGIIEVKEFTITNICNKNTPGN